MTNKMQALTPEQSKALWHYARLLMVVVDYIPANVFAEAQRQAIEAGALNEKNALSREEWEVLGTLADTIKQNRPVNLS